jgi:hypothetical protein
LFQVLSKIAETPITTAFHAAKWHLWLVVHGLVADMHRAGFEAYRNVPGAGEVFGEDARGESIL